MDGDDPNCLSVYQEMLPASGSVKASNTSAIANAMLVAVAETPITSVASKKAKTH